jgi:nickel-dependent lactate racemase
MDIALKYGKQVISFSLHAENEPKMIYPNKGSVTLTGEAAVINALANPVGVAPLRAIVNPGETVSVITSDITRPLPGDRILPHVIREIAAGGVQMEDITIILALGSHRKHTEEEKKALVGCSVYGSGVRILDSDMSQCERIGRCKNGTWVDIFRPALDTDRIVCIGNIEYHYFAGYSGGAKAIMPGISSRDAIQSNHANMMKPGAFSGNLAGNPVREDIDEVRNFIQIDFIVNVVLDENKEMIHASAGDVMEAHRKACLFLDSIYKTALKEQADIVIVSSGGFPKDINLYQAQKALDNARHAVKSGGIIIWCASAAEGFGEGVFETWMRTMEPAEMISRIQKEFQLGGHKAAAIAMVMEQAKIYMVCDLPDDLIRSLHMRPFPDVQAAVDKALEEKGQDAKVYVMPVGGSTLPVFVDQTRKLHQL